MFDPDRLLPLGAVGVVVLFLFAVQLLGTATEAAAPFLRELFRRLVVGDPGALGLSWLGSYALANGSVVAALALSLFTADIVTPGQLFAMIAGSRLGGAAVVVFIGALDYFQKRRFSLQESVSMGLLTFLVTHSIYLPATVIGYVALPFVAGTPDETSTGFTLGVHPLGFIEPTTEAITTALGPVLTFVLAVALLFGSLQLFDRLLASVDTATIRRRFLDHLQRTWVSFLIGLLVTGVTTSVAFSLGVIVPLYNRGYVKRRELVPYMLGANLGTLFDTIVVAIVLETGVGLAVVLELLAVATGVTIVALVVHARYIRVIAAADDLLLADRRVFTAVVLSLVLVPAAFLLVPAAIG